MKRQATARQRISRLLWQAGYRPGRDFRIVLDNRSIRIVPGRRRLLPRLQQIARAAGCLEVGDGR